MDRDISGRVVSSLQGVVPLSDGKYPPVPVVKLSSFRASGPRPPLLPPSLFASFSLSLPLLFPRFSRSSVALLGLRTGFSAVKHPSQTPSANRIEDTQNTWDHTTHPPPH